jgi:hypothetical protein
MSAAEGVRILLRQVRLALARVEAKVDLLPNARKAAR